MKKVEIIDFFQKNTTRFNFGELKKTLRLAVLTCSPILKQKIANVSKKKKVNEK